MNMVTIIGADGFVGSAFVRYLTTQGISVTAVTLQNYADKTGKASQIVIEAGCNSKKYLADEEPKKEFDLSVAHRLRTLRDFPSDLHVHVSSVDVYHDLTSPETTNEDIAIDLVRISHYGLHKLMAEQLVRHYAPKWIIVRLAGMVGPGLKKNPIYDILHGHPLRIHPDSKYQFMSTDSVARTVWNLLDKKCQNEVFNICGQGLISPREVAKLADLTLELRGSFATSQPRIVDINTSKISAWENLPNTMETVSTFVSDYLKQKRSPCES